MGLLRVDAAGEAAVRRPGRGGLQPGHGTGRCAGSHRRRRDAGGGGGPGDALAAWQGRVGAQPPWAEAPERRCVMAVANVDIPALKARHPLGDTVEASGVRLRGRGRVRQGVCPFHDEAGGFSFTVYADSERFYCFGCGLGGDVLDFIQQAEGLSLPDAIARLDGSPGLAPRAATRPAGTRRPCVRRAAPTRPHPPDGGGALLRRTAPAFLRSAGVPGLAGRRPGRRSPPRSRLCAGRRAAAGPGVPRLLREAHQGLRAVHGAGSGAVRRHGRRSRRISGGLVRWLAGRAVDPGRTPRFQALPGPKPVLGLGQSRPRSALGDCRGGPVRLARPYRMGPSRLSPL